MELGALDEGPEALPRDARVSVGALVDRASEAGFGAVFALLSLIAIPFFGLSTPFGLAMALGGVQLLAGRSRPWLPRRARARTMPLSTLDRVATLLQRRTQFLKRVTRRRWEWLMLGPARNLAGLSVTLLSLGLALPLPIPGSNLIFLVPLFAFGLGLIERDGAWIVFGHVCLVVNLGLLVAFGALVENALLRLVRC